MPVIRDKQQAHATNFSTDKPQDGVEKCCNNTNIKVLTIKLLTALNVCEPAVFKVDSYEGQPTPGDKNNIQWMLHDVDTDENLLDDHNSVIEKKGEKLIIHCVPLEWYERTLKVSAEFNTRPEKTMLEQSVAAAEVFDWIMTIRKAEEAYPDWTPVEITNSMRREADYDKNEFRRMYGGIAEAKALSPRGPLTQDDINNLKKWTDHKTVSTGLVTDIDGNRLAAGHVLTGISAGVYRNKETYMYLIQEYTPIGEAMDNLHATTLAGDLGQAAAKVEEGKQEKPYIGPHGEADDAELVGDIDGFILGSQEPKGGSGRKLSEILTDYYCSCKPTPPFRQRMSRFDKIDKEELKNQVIAFASNYIYKLKTDDNSIFPKKDRLLIYKYINKDIIDIPIKYLIDSPRGLFTRITDNVGIAFLEFELWLFKKKEEELINNKNIKINLQKLKE